MIPPLLCRKPIALCPILSQVADFHLKWSIPMENPKDNTTGSKYGTIPNNGDLRGSSKASLPLHPPSKKRGYDGQTQATEFGPFVAG